MPADPRPSPKRATAGRATAGRATAAQGLGAPAPAGRAVAKLPAAQTGLRGRLTRRSALAGLAATSVALAVAGCTPKQATPAAELIAGDALGPTYTETFTLIASYDQALASAPALVELLGPMREEHRQHLIALASLIGLAMPAVALGPYPSGIPLPPPHPTTSPSPHPTTSPSPSSTNPPSANHTATPSGPTPPPPDESATESTPPGSPATSTSAPPVAPSVSPAGLSPALIKAQLSGAEKTAQANAVAVCISVAAERVPIIAAIAACRATHVAALR